MSTIAANIIVEFNGPKGWEVSREYTASAIGSQSPPFVHLRELIAEGYDARLTFEQPRVQEVAA